MKTSRRKLGDRGEALACAFLESRGLQVIERNWTCGHLETDIIAFGKDGIHFVEVKSRVAPVSADPLSNVTAEKQRRLVTAARRYLSGASGFQDSEVFFDVVTVVFDGCSEKLEYYPQAFTPIYL